MTEDRDAENSFEYIYFFIEISSAFIRLCTCIYTDKPEKEIANAASEISAAFVKHSRLESIFTAFPISKKIDIKALAKWLFVRLLKSPMITEKNVTKPQMFRVF